MPYEYAVNVAVNFKQEFFDDTPVHAWLKS